LLACRPQIDAQIKANAEAKRRAEMNRGDAQVDSR
jgi:hypothetical protein